jgi:lipoprotein-releasing system permease protein
VYKLLLCVRYLKTRYLAFVCIVSVMLGVATLIVVNAVMSGFSTKLKDRLHGILSDVVIDTEVMDGFIKTDANGQVVRGPDGMPQHYTADEMIAKIKASPVGDRIVAISPTIEVFAILQFQTRGQTITKPVKVIGVDPASRKAVGGFSEYLVRQKDKAVPSFDLDESALKQLDDNRRRRELLDPFGGAPPRSSPFPPANPVALEPPPLAHPLAVPGGQAAPRLLTPAAPADMMIGVGTPEAKIHGVIPGYNIAHFRYRDNGELIEKAALLPGDPVTITTVGGGNELKPVWGTFVVADYVKTEMSEYDSGLVYVSLEQLQRLRGMGERCTALQIKLRGYEKDKKQVVEELTKLFPADYGTRVATWEDHQGPLLSAIEVERGILNLLLFMIVGVAGFSILAIFTMIVSEKYRDIGIMKSLGASSWGVLSIFLGYGLLLGTVGCAAGTALGLLITDRINGIEAWLTRQTGHAVFPRDVYYFKEIPTNVDFWSVALVNAGAVFIAVVFSILPAYRAARLQPVRALRFE